MARRKRSARPDDDDSGPGMLPVMSCMFLLIPALLLGMEVARFASVHVTAPKVRDGGRDPSVTAERLKLTVMIRSDGFAASIGEGEQTTSEIPLASASEHDYDALTAMAVALKARAPDDGTVTLRAEGDVELQTVVRTMDALRGPECSLARVAAGEAPPPSCLFWNVIVQS